MGIVSLNILPKEYNCFFLKVSVLPHSAQFHFFPTLSGQRLLQYNWNISAVFFLADTSYSTGKIIMDFFIFVFF